MTAPEWESRAAFDELLELLGAADRVFVEGDRAVRDETSVAEGYRYLTEALHAALEIYLWSDAARPHFVPIVGPTFKWGGDNSDAFYNYAPGRARRHVPHPRQARRRLLPVGVRIRRSRRRPLVHAYRVEPE